MLNKQVWIFIVSVLFLLYLFYLIGSTRIIIHFKDLDPLRERLSVYYNGFKIGRSIKIYPDKDYKSTLMDIRVDLRKLRLPANTTATLRRKDKKDYIELVYPKSPYLENLKRNDIIEGYLGINFEHYLQAQAESGGLDEIKENVNRTIVSAGKTFDSLTGMIDVLADILKDVQPLITDTAKNLELTSKNLAEASLEINKSISKGYIDKSLYNIQQTSDNLVLITKNTTGFTDGLNKQSSILVNCLLKNLNLVVCNINIIVENVKDTLNKNLGGLRLIFKGTS
ncbi:hypothetical protein J6R97_06120 [bacterium]|nr:hypothetical protein [bacterium]